MGSHVGVKAVQSTSTSSEKLCDRFGKELLDLGLEVVGLQVLDGPQTEDDCPGSTCAIV